MLDGSAHIDAPGAPSLPIFLLCARGFNEPLMTDKQSRRGSTSYVISLLGLLCHCLFPKERLPHGF